MVNKDICSIIKAAFERREWPESVVPEDFPDTCEYSDSLAFATQASGTLTVADIKKFSDAIYGFTPEAFLYFLPKILIAAVSAEEPDLLVNDAIVGMLDRSDDPSMWDNFFVDRWGRLDISEIKACQEWLLWLAGFDVIPSESITRSFDTLETLLRNLE